MIVAIAEPVHLELSFIYNLKVFLECDHRDRLTLFSNRRSRFQAQLKNISDTLCCKVLFVTRWIDLRPGGTNTTNTFRFIFTFRAWLMPRLPFAMLFAGKIKIIQCITKHKTKALNYFFQYYQYVTISWSRNWIFILVWPLPIPLKKFHFNRVIIFFKNASLWDCYPS